MNEKNSFHYDPLYRVIDVTEEMRFIEGSFKKLYDRLKGISNLGIIPQLLGMAKYPKYEHHLGALYQINCLLQCADKNLIPDEYHLPLRLSALFLHLGHLPFTYSTERAILLASSLGSDDRDNKAKKHLKDKIINVLQQVNFDDDEQQEHLKKLFSLENYRNLYKYLSSFIFLDSWNKIKAKYKLKNEQKMTIIKNLIDFKNDGYKYLELADKADFVQRDALYFGTVRLDISPKHLYGQKLLGSIPEFLSVSEERLIESNLNYLRERFYDSDRIRWFARLYEKIMASLIFSKNFKIDWLFDFDDSQLKRLITENRRPDIKPAKLPPNWIGRAKDLFDGKVDFSLIFKLLNISFEKQNDAIDIEHKLLRKVRSLRGVLSYPFEKGVLIDADYSEKHIFLVEPNYRQFSVTVFQDNEKIKFVELLKIIKQVGYYCSIVDVEDIKTSHIRNIREGLCKQFSWTESIRINNIDIIKAICEAIGNIENGENYGKGEFILKFLKSITSIKQFDKLWHNFENGYFWLSNIKHVAKEHKENIEESAILYGFVEGMFSLPLRLLQYKTTIKNLEEIYTKLREMISEATSNGKKGCFFEALWMIDRIRKKRGKYQFLINGMVVVDPKKPKKERDIHEFDVIELLINESGKAECWIYACSIADDYVNKNRSQLDKLASNIHQIYKDLIIRTRYIIPEDKSRRNWNPKEEETGVGSWN